MARLLESHHLPAGHPGVPTFSLELKSIGQAFQVWESMLDQSVYVNLVLPPASPRKLPVIRISVCADHSDHEISRIVEALVRSLK